MANVQYILTAQNNTTKKISHLFLYENGKLKIDGDLVDICNRLYYILNSKNYHLHDINKTDNHAYIRWLAISLPSLKLRSIGVNKSNSFYKFRKCWNRFIKRRNKLKAFI